MDIKNFIRTIPDHPKPGIQFRDITTLLLDPVGLRLAIDGLCGSYVDAASKRPDVVVGPEARGFLFGTAIADRLGLGFVPLRKPGKLPAKRLGATSIWNTGQIASSFTWMPHSRGRAYC